MLSRPGQVVARRQPQDSMRPMFRAVSLGGARSTRAWPGLFGGFRGDLGHCRGLTVPATYPEIGSGGCKVSCRAAGWSHLMSHRPARRATTRRRRESCSMSDIRCVAINVFHVEQEII